MDNNLRLSLGKKPFGRMGYGAMRLPGLRGVAEDAALAHRLLSRAVDLGANVIDTADFYGAGLANKLIAEALVPYPENLIISTKVGVKAGVDGRPVPAATPDEIQATVERNLTTLGVDALDLVFLRLAGGPLADSGVPIQSSLACLERLQQQGLIRHIGLSSVTASQFAQASALIPIAAVQNAYFIGHTGSHDVLQQCSEVNIPFFAYFPLGMGKLMTQESLLGTVASAHGATKSQTALAWLLALSPIMVPIPGTAQIAHLEENMAAVDLRLSAAEIDALSNLHPV
jgi:aryl-alcohol dehydrogenase-like predicted oxidoreductase